MALNLTKNVHIRRDAAGRARHVRHPQQPYQATDAGLTVVTPRLLASAYAHDAAKLFQFSDDLLSQLDEPVTQSTKSDEGSRLKFETEKTIQDSTVVGYHQTYNGLPIWEAGLAVHVQRSTLSVSSATNTIHYDIRLEKPKRPQRSPRIDLDDDDALAKVLAIERRRGQERAVINERHRRLIYRYEAALRIDPEAQHDDHGLSAPPPTLPLPPVPETIIEGAHYEVVELLFTLNVADMGPVHWRAFVEPETGAVLYLRALVSSAFGNVYLKDPLTRTGNVAITPASAAGSLDPITDLVTLVGLTAPNPGDPQPLRGEFVEIFDNSAPTIPPPTAPLPPGNFSFSAVTDHFSAVNAYVHCDWLFRLVSSFGIDVDAYFDGTTFPVPVDHRGLGNVVNAQAPGNPAGNGSGGFKFALAMAGAPVGIATDRRVVLHEFGHTLLWDHVHSPNFGFAHSAGDGLAAILCDPGSAAPDRFLTFPWITTSTAGIDRRHDRDVAAGWGWDGANDVGGYSSEQILATTHFRIYRSTGGDDPRLAVKEFAARYLAYLIIKAIGTLTPTTNPSHADDWATALMDADLTNLDFEGHPGGAFHKVIRWGFEKQGLYQPAGAPMPVTTPGAAPDVDVYINDGRNGEYQYKANFWNNADIWCRNAADGGTAHQSPIVNVPNFLYVRVKNRGTQTAQNVAVKAYNCIPAAGLVWPDDWTPMTTAELSAPDIPSGGDVIVGPFEWTPQVIGHECVLASVSADGDPSNADTVNGPIPHWRLVPFDNNIGQRNLAPVAGGGGSLQLLRSFLNRRFLLRNPLPRTATVQVDIHLPGFLQKLGWKLQVNAGGKGRFTLGPRGSREMRFAMTAGGDFTPADVKAAGADTRIDVFAIVDGLPVGGMSYEVVAELKEPPRETPEVGIGKHCVGLAEELLDCLNLPGHEVQKVRIRRVTVDIDIKADCD